MSSIVRLSARKYGTQGTNCTNFTIGEKFRNFMELYDFYVLFDNMSAFYSWACST